MRCNWRRWLWGIIPLLVLSWVAVQAEHGRLERDLAERARLALVEGGFTWAQAEFKARDAVLTGRAPQEGEPGKAADALAAVWGVRVVDNKADLLDKAEKYVWTASRRNNRIRLSGYAPSIECPAGHPGGDEGELSGVRDRRPHDAGARRSIVRCLAGGRQLRIEAADRHQARRRPPGGPGPRCHGRGRGCHRLPHHQAGARQQRAQGHQGDGRPRHGTGGEPLHVGRALGRWPARAVRPRAERCRAGRPGGRRQGGPARRRGRRPDGAGRRRTAGLGRAWRSQFCARWGGSRVVARI